MEDNGAQISRPSKVSMAVTLLYVALAIAVLRLPIELHVIWQENQQVPVPVIVFIAMAVVAFFWFLIYKIGRGRNWARITYLVIFVLGVPGAVTGLFRSSGVAQASALLGVPEGILEIVALVFLFQAPSN